MRDKKANRNLSGRNFISPSCNTVPGVLAKSFLGENTLVKKCLGTLHKDDSSLLLAGAKRRCFSDLHNENLWGSCSWNPETCESPLSLQLLEVSLSPGSTYSASRNSPNFPLQYSISLWFQKGLLEAEIHFCLRDPLISPDLGWQSALQPQCSDGSKVSHSFFTCPVLSGWKDSSKDFQALVTADTTNPKVTLASFLSNLPHFSYTFISGLIDINENLYWCWSWRTDADAETPILWPPDVKNWLLGKDPDAGKDWGQEEKGAEEDEMVGWHHRLNRHEFEQAPGDGDGQGSLAWCSPWSLKELDTTEWLNWTELMNGQSMDA